MSEQRSPAQWWHDQVRGTAARSTTRETGFRLAVGVLWLLGAAYWFLLADSGFAVPMGVVWLVIGVGTVALYGSVLLALRRS